MVVEAPVGAAAAAAARRSSELTADKQRRGEAGVPQAWHARSSFKRLFAVLDGEIYGIAADDSGGFNILRVSNNAELVLDRIFSDGRLTSTVQVLIAPSELTDLESL